MKAKKLLGAGMEKEIVRSQVNHHKRNQRLRHNGIWLLFNSRLFVKLIVSEGSSCWQCIPFTASLLWSYLTDPFISKFENVYLKVSLFFSWGPCSSSCLKTYTISTESEYEGLQCEYDDGETSECLHGEGSCPVPSKPETWRRDSFSQKMFHLNCKKSEFLKESFLYNGPEKTFIFLLLFSRRREGLCFKI